MTTHHNSNNQTDNSNENLQHISPNGTQSYTEIPAQGDNVNCIADENSADIGRTADEKAPAEQEQDAPKKEVVVPVMPLL
ncbi:hypothetical protein B0181_03005 [Moraxella caviae]|uniref:Uncharacterized protein n=1 Tax=Moraxella caviae TaxID=34060 RepID=A0A1T0A7G2_9GAMM|nr:hypothetical protein [Moraxella caviae]OOR91538.1 hypothetical protein B0181_03005 [Moraxella caviae]STZ14376.1 Uncharacterised protein [Moraxella caviae]VEW12821.1 Uncharacterised protein [Moraxella caviae]